MNKLITKYILPIILLFNITSAQYAINLTSNKQDQKKDSIIINMVNKYKHCKNYMDSITIFVIAHRSLGKKTPDTLFNTT